MNAARLIAPAVVAALVAFFLTPLARKLSFAWGAVDEPGSRKVHLTPMPRLGGLAVLAAFLLVRLASGTSPVFSAGPLSHRFGSALLGGLVVIFSVSLVDDLRGVRAEWKALSHFVGAGIAVAGGIRLAPHVHLFEQTVHLEWFAIPLSIVWIVGVTNAFNLVDGLDGLSTGLALISSTGLSIVFLVSGQKELAAAVLVLAGALAGFLPHNAHPAKIFLGDAGAASVGFILACFALNGGAVLSGGFAILVPVFVLGYPVVETLLSMLRRLIHRLETHAGSVFEADGDHIHHRLVGLGFDHRRSVLLIYAAGAGAVLIGLASIFVSNRQAGFLLAALLLGAAIGIGRLGYDEFAFLRKGAVLRVYDAPVVRSVLFAPFFDLSLVPVGYYLAHGLKTDVWAIVRPDTNTLNLVAILALASVGSYWAFGLYRRSWSIASLDAVARAGVAVAAAVAGSWGIASFLGADPSAALFAIYALMSFVLVCGSRLSYQFFEAETWKAGEGEPVLIYGAGKAGAAALNEILGNRKLNLRAVGFIDDAPLMQGRFVGGAPILGPLAALDEAIVKHGVRQVIVSMPEVSPERLDEALDVCRRREIPLVQFEVRFSRFVETSGTVPGPPG